MRLQEELDQVLAGFIAAGRSRKEPGNDLLSRLLAATDEDGSVMTDQQLRDNLGAVGWALTAEQVARLDAAGAVTLPYPHWHQRGFAERNPPPVA